jgi:hypothetical protein
VVTLSNLYIVITIVLGILVLHEPITVLKIVGLTCTMAGVLVLAHPPARHAAHPEASSDSTPLQARGFAIMGIYIVMIGVGAFLQKPALKGLAATQLNALMGTAMTAVAGIALAVRGPRLPMTKRTLGGLGVGVMIGTASVFYFLGLRGLPVSVASAASNSSVVVTVVQLVKQATRRGTSCGAFVRCAADGAPHEWPEVGLGRVVTACSATPPCSTTRSAAASSRPGSTCPVPSKAWSLTPVSMPVALVGLTV